MWKCRKYSNILQVNGHPKKQVLNSHVIILRALLLYANFKETVWLHTVSTQYLLWRSCVTDWSISNFWGTYLKTENTNQLVIVILNWKFFFWLNKMDVSECIVGRDMLWKVFVRVECSDLWQLQITCLKHTTLLKRHLGLSISCDGLRTFLPLLSDFRGASPTVTGEGWNGSLYERRNTQSRLILRRRVIYPKPQHAHVMKAWINWNFGSRTRFGERLFRMPTENEPFLCHKVNNRCKDSKVMSRLRAADVSQCSSAAEPQVRFWPQSGR